MKLDQNSKAIIFSIFLIGLFITAWVWPDNPQGAGATAAVRKITVTFNGAPATAKGFTWYTNQNAKRSDLQIVAKTAAPPDFSKAIKFSGHAATPTNSPLELVHKAKATGLKPATSYYFRVGDATRNLWSASGSFQTAPTSGAFTFIDLSDTQAVNAAEARLSAQTIAKALRTVNNAQFVVLNGDLVEVGNNETQWDLLLGFSKDSLLNTTLAPAAGNHELQTNAFIDHFNLKTPARCNTQTGAYYSFTYCKAHFVILNTNESSAEYAGFTPTQIQWLKEDVKTARGHGGAWVIVVMHIGPYTTSTHATDEDIDGGNGIRTKTAPILANLGVDLVLQGHDHIHARSKPINQDGVAVKTAKRKRFFAPAGGKVEYLVNPEGTVYLIPNTAGAKVYRRNARIAPDYFSLFDVAGEQPAALSGPNPRRRHGSGRGRIQNFIGITVERDRLTALTYEIDQNKNNAKPYISDRFGIIKKINQSPASPHIDKVPGLQPHYGRRSGT
jgi:3',5'-cyclic AMP phosphodiesterase CpdA